ncbi:DNA cytosine methyltransferase [Solidesulfovibrio sp. C21]
MANVLEDIPDQHQKKYPGKLPLLDFFAGSGLVSYALSRYFDLVWSNDVCPKKADVFRTNYPDKPFKLASIAGISGDDVPAAALSWASFPCQDLSLAGPAKGIRASRSGLVWEWLRVMDTMKQKPPLVVAENVIGLLSTHEGRHYAELHNALMSRGYRVGAIVLDAIHFVPQSRPRVFVIGVDVHAPRLREFESNGPNWLHPLAVIRAAAGVESFVWWNMPQPRNRAQNLSDIVDLTIPCHDAARSKKNLALIPLNHLLRLNECGLNVVPGYKRIRQGRQVLELRFDDVAGCLRTPGGGSSKQFLVIRCGSQWRTRLLTPREAAKLMGAPRGFILPTSANDAYRAMGDAVAVPVARYLAKSLLSKIAAVSYGHP